jgi:hypothetical protein
MAMTSSSVNGVADSAFEMIPRIPHMTYSSTTGSVQVESVTLKWD